MKPTQNLPANFVLAWVLDLKHNTRLNLILQVVGLVWMGLAAWFLFSFALWLRQDFAKSLADGVSIDLLGALLVLVVLIVSILLHELVHGLFFWLFSRHRPEFGVGPGYAFAAMPDWFYPKYQYLAIALSPLMVLTALGVLASAFVPMVWLNMLLTGMIINAGGAIGDMYVAWRIALEPEQIWVKDTGDGFQVYRQQGNI
jgi:hypothetical protein